MDKATEDLNKSSYVLLDAQVNLQTIQAQILKIDKDLAMLTMVKANLEENIRVLKRRRAIVMASEFKKSTNDLSTCETRMAFLRVDRENILKNEKYADGIYQKAKAEYERLLDLVQNPPDNVIYVDFGRKDG
jgi:flagellar biosynthesis chaperone FliJ